MSLPEISVKKPVTVLMVTMILVLFGVVSLMGLPVELYPNTSFGQISIIIQARGGIPPTEVEELVTKVVEEGVATVSNLEQLLSISKEGESTVVMSFKSGTDMDFAALEVREKFAKVKNQLPKEIEKPVIAQFQQGDVPVFIVAATSERRSTEDIRKIVDQSMKDNLKRVPGVANVEVAGGRERKILVEIDQVRLAAYGLAMDQVTGALGGNNLNLLSGEVERTTDRYLIRMIGEFDSIEKIKNMPLTFSDQGTAIRVKDVAAVKDSYLEPNEFSRLNIQPVVTLYVQKESTKNTITVCKNLVKAIEEAKHILPRDIHLVVTSNQAEFIDKAIENLKESLLQGIVLIFLVFFVFLFRMSKPALIFVLAALLVSAFAKGWLLMVIFVGMSIVIAAVPSFRSIFIVNAPIPLSILGTFTFMFFASTTFFKESGGLTVNVMTLFGMALGVGMLMDTSIVVFENTLKKRDSGMGIVAAAIEGSQEMLLPIIASTLSQIIVFLPLLFAGQELQRLYASMALVIVATQIISMFCAITIIPLLCSRSRTMSSNTDWVKRFALMQRKYLFLSIRYRRYVLIGSVLTVLVASFFMAQLGTEYLGSTEQNKFTIYVEMPTGARLDMSDKTVKKVEALAKRLPEVKTVTSRVEPWSSKVYVELVKSDRRKRSANDVIEVLRQETAKMHPAFIYYQQEEQVGTKEVILDIFGYNYAKLRELAIAITNRLEGIKGLSDTKIRMREGRPEMQLKVDKRKAGIFDMSVSDVANQVHGQMRGFRATVYHTEGKEVETISRLDEKYRKTFKDLHNLILSSKDGTPVLLDQVSNFKFGLGPSEIWRKDRNRMIQVSSNIGKVPLGKVVEQLKQKLKDVTFPEDYFYRVGGDYPTLVSTSRQMQMMITFVLVLIYLVLASLFESFWQPLLIMIAVPLALVGAIAALYFGPKSIGVGALLGMMLLGGIVVNNTIILLERINSYVDEKRLSPVRAAILAVGDRIRPILMTQSCTILGLLPMALDRSEGANLWAPLAMTVIGGVISSTLLTLMITPAFYVLFIDAGRLIKRWGYKIMRAA